MINYARSLKRLGDRLTKEQSKGLAKKGVDEVAKLARILLVLPLGRSTRRNILMVSSQNLAKDISADSVGEGTKSSLIAEEDGQKGE